MIDETLMKKPLIIVTIIFTLFLLLILNSTFCYAKMYKYKDENGIWHYSNVPVNLSFKSDEVENIYEIGDTDLQKQVFDKFPAKNLIEEARNGTVVIQCSSKFGSGFFINKKGFILTNKHVIAKCENVKVFLIDQTEINASIVSISNNYDLALLRAYGYKTPFIEPGDAKDLAQGEFLYAIGNPEAFTHSVTSGVFSGLRKSSNEGEFLQTSVQINPGNSGGPLVTANGKVIGINTKKIIDVGVEGMGFAIPIYIALDEFKDKF